MTNSSALRPVMPHLWLFLTWTGGDSRSVPYGHGCVSSAGPGGKWHCDSA